MIFLCVGEKSYGRTSTTYFVALSPLHPSPLSLRLAICIFFFGSLILIWKDWMSDLRGFGLWLS
jgi:hypothetical protein